MPSEKYVADHDYSDADLLALFRQCLAAITVKGQMYVISGRTFTNADLLEVRNTFQMLQRRVDAATHGLITNQIELKRR